MASVRAEIPEDILEIRRVNELAFGTPAEADLVEMLRAAGKVLLSLVAVEENRVVGHILISRVTIGSSEPVKLLDSAGLSQDDIFALNRRVEFIRQ